jgi:hypothetical protein
VAHEVAAEVAARLGDAAVGGELDEVGRLLVLELVPVEQPELHRRGRDALLEVRRGEPEAVAEELDHEVVARGVVRLRHVLRIAPATLAVVRRNLVFLALVLLSALGAAWLLELTWERAIYLAPVIVICSLVVTALVVLWTKVIVETVRGSRRDDDESVTNT